MATWGSCSRALDPGRRHERNGGPADERLPFDSGYPSATDTIGAMSLSALSSPDAVLRAIAEFDQLGQRAFLPKYGFHPARSYLLVHDGRRYDSKAVAAAAHGFQFPSLGPLGASEFSGGEATVGRRLRALGFEVEGPDTLAPLPHLEVGTVYSWEQLSGLFGFKPAYLGAAGGIVSRPEHDALLLITHPGGGKSFDYEDYWDGADLIYTGRGKNGDQTLDGPNGDVAANSKELLVFENVGSRQLRYLR